MSSSCSTTITELPMIAQMLERGDQPVVVALMQADGRFVEHVHHARQAGTDLRCQPDTLRLAAGKRLGAAFQRQIVEPDVIQERQPRDDFLDDPIGDLAFRAFKAQRLEIAERRRAAASR